jgi:signal transduction histidine kinase
VIEVRDDGAGLEPELMARLFEPFVQCSQTLDRSRGGLGLGLALVKGLAELHGGRVAVASEGPGRGATFTVRLQADAGDGAVRRDPARDPAALQDAAVRP